MATEDLGEVDDRALVAAITGRDDAAMAEVVRRHRGPVVAFPRRLVGDGARAEEISQEVFLRLWEQSSRFDVQRGSLRTFLFAITHGRALDVVRSDAARQAPRAARCGRTIAPRLESSRRSSRSLSPAQCALRSRSSRILSGRAVELAYFGGHSYRTVARMLDEPEGTVKSRIRSGLAKLRGSPRRPGLARSVTTPRVSRRVW